MSKIAVVGPIPRDTINTHKDEIITKYGCILHPSVALGKLLENKGEVVPIANVHKKDSAAIKKIVENYTAISTSSISDEADSGTVIFLDFKDKDNREEKQTAFMKPILPKDVKPHLDADAFVFVPITDFEIPLQTITYIKKHSQAKIIFDAHGPTTCATVSGDRLRRFWVEMSQWLPYIDVLKMNLEESQCCWYKNEYDISEMKSYNIKDRSHLDEMADHILQYQTQYFYVTLDDEGCVLYQKGTDGAIEKTFIPSMKMEDVIDTTGCGDSFAGGLAYGLAKYKDPIKAGQFGNVLGALRTQGKTFDVFKNQQKTEKLVDEFYSK